MFSKIFENFFHIYLTSYKVFPLTKLNVKNISHWKRKRKGRAKREEKMSRMVRMVFIPFSLQGDRSPIAFCLHFHRRRLHESTISNRCERGRTRVTQFHTTSHVFFHVHHDCELLHRGTRVSALRAMWLAGFLKHQASPKEAYNTLSTSLVRYKYK